MTDENPSGDPSPIGRPSWVDRVSRLTFIELFEKYRKRIVHQETMLPFDPTDGRDAPYTFEALAFETGWGLRLSLKLFMPFCIAVFALSYALAPFEMVSRLVRSCSVAGMIGFGTNWVAIKMLFWPREPRPVFGQGLIPSQRDQLIQKVADEVLEKLINAELIEEKVNEIGIAKRFSDALIGKLRIIVADAEFKDDLRDVVLTSLGDIVADETFRSKLASSAEQRLEEFAGPGLKTWMVKKLKDVWRAPLIELIDNELANLDSTVVEGLSHVDGVVESLPEALDNRQDQIDHVLTTMLMGLVHEVDVRAIVLEQLSTVTTEQLERGFREFSDDKLSFITLLGGVLGLVGGTVLVWPLPSAMVLISLFAVLAVIDILAAPLMRRRYWPKKKAEVVLEHDADLDAAATRATGESVGDAVAAPVDEVETVETSAAEAKDAEAA